MNWVVRAPDSALGRQERKLFTRVRATLWEYEPLRASHAQIFIDVDGQAVRLRGRVRTLPQKLIAAALVRHMSDVSTVANDLIADPEVIRAVADALAEDERTAPYVLRVDARHGIVTLVGEVPSEEVARVAIEIATRVPSGVSVRNNLVVGGEVRPAVALARPSTVPDELNPVTAATVRA